MIISHELHIFHGVKNTLPSEEIQAKSELKFLCIFHRGYTEWFNGASSAFYTNVLARFEWSFIKAPSMYGEMLMTRRILAKKFRANLSGPWFCSLMVWPNSEMTSRLSRKWWAACLLGDSLLASFPSSGLLIESEHKKLMIVITGRALECILSTLMLSWLHTPTDRECPARTDPKRQPSILHKFVIS